MATSSPKVRVPPAVLVQEMLNWLGEVSLENRYCHMPLCNHIFLGTARVNLCHDLY